VWQQQRQAVAWSMSVAAAAAHRVVLSWLWSGGVILFLIVLR